VTTLRAARPWAARIATGDARAVAVLRLLRGVEAAEVDGEAAALWIRGPDLSDDIDAALRRVPGLERFHLLPADLLATPDGRVPEARLPALAWRPIAQHFDIALPPPATAGDRPTSVVIRVVASSAERRASGVLTDVGAWETWCAGASEIRLQRLRFAARADGCLLVRGDPTPPIRGAIPLWEDTDILVPCGHVPAPDIGGEALRVVFGLADGDVALLGVDGAFEVIPGAAFAAASRSAARLTRSGLAGL
jgi:hypothetical protein